MILYLNFNYVQQELLFSVQKKQPKLICENDYPKGVVVDVAVETVKDTVVIKVI